MFRFFYQSLTYQPVSTIGTTTSISAIRTGRDEQSKETFGRGRALGLRPWHSEWVSWSGSRRMVLTGGEKVPEKVAILLST
jgi:hypothetical protein